MPYHATESGPDTADQFNALSQLASSSCFHDAYEGASKVVQASAREVTLVTVGSIGGALNEIQKNPVETLCRAGTTFAVGAGLGALAVAETPVLAIGAVTAGATMTGLWAWDTLNPYDPRNQTRYSKIGSALRDTWSHADSSTFQKSLQNMQEGAGPITLDLGLMALGGKGAQLGAHHGPSVINKFAFLNESQLAPATIPGYYDIKSWGLGNSSVSDYAFFKTRSGRAKVNAGPPETVDARLAELDALQKLDAKVLPKSNLNIQASSTRPTDVLAPPQDKMGRSTFYFGHLQFQKR